MTDEEQVAASDESPDDAGAEAPAGQRSPALVLAISLAVVFALAAAVFGVLAVRADTGEGDRVTSLRKAAGQVGEALLTYDYKDPKAHRDSVLALATGSFRTEYKNAFDQGLGELITKVKATSRGFVKDVYVSSIDEDSAQAIVVADVTRNGAGGERTLPDIYILLTFVDVHGTWKVDQVTDLNFAAEGGAAPTGTTSTSTPVP